MQVFKCRNCKQLSTYANPKSRALVEMMRTSFSPFTTRTYICVICKTENSIDLTDQQWLVIDMEARSQ
jgi:hypothetical protein